MCGWCFLMVVANIINIGVAESCLGGVFVGVAVLPHHEKLVLTSLALDPSCQGCIAFVATGHIAMSKFTTEFREFLQTFTPLSSLRIPNETNFLQSLDPFLGHRGGLDDLITTVVLDAVIVHVGVAISLRFLKKQLVLITLAFDPTSQGKIGLMCVRHQTMAVYSLKVQKLCKSFRPLTSLKWALAFRCRLELGPLLTTIALC
mmetsp:Transcript_8399/g.11034  ORF Transcript_8399/g.11034 Transcript_8399/m.11034 type:complete len:203 (-) Transcript_8399:619-1227(-)